MNQHEEATGESGSAGSSLDVRAERVAARLAEINDQLDRIESRAAQAQQRIHLWISESNRDTERLEHALGALDGRRTQLRFLVEELAAPIDRAMEQTTPPREATRNGESPPQPSPTETAPPPKFLHDGAAESARASVQSLAALAEEKTRQLNSHHAAAARTLRELGEANVKARTTLQEIVERIDEGAAAIEASDRLLREFMAQAQTLQNNLQRLQEQASRLETRWQEGLSQPAEMITAAQGHAAQLERVCDIVRKVMSNLSQTALEAGRHAVEYRRTSDEAVRRLAELKSETAQSAATLREWVEEAVRVQSRLERTLQTAPALPVTHPAALLHQASRKLTAAGDGRSALGPDAVPATSSAGDKREPSPLRETAARAAQIAAMIEEAKRAAATP